ncbi:MAG: RibD family protein, partial [Candidatus Gastranaerophilales bacterium]|nr:RibD family protein [Candidatus Gastranaerophilales bacterium]
KYDAILTSSSTVIADNPQMLHKTKIILDRTLKTDFNSEIYKTGKIYLVTAENITINNIPQNIEIIKCETKNNRLDLKDLMKKLFEKNIKSILVESGGTLNGDFIKENLVDKIYHFIAPKILNDNSGKSCFNGENISKIIDCKVFNIDSLKKIHNDILITYYRK